MGMTMDADPVVAVLKIGLWAVIVVGVGLLIVGPIFLF